MKTQITLKSKNSGKSLNVTFSFGSSTTYSIDGIGKVSAKDMTANFELGYTRLAEEQIRKENIGRTITIKKEISFGGAGVCWNAKIDGEDVCENIAKIFFKGTPSNGKHITTEDNIINVKRIEADTAEKEWIENAKLSQDFGF
jgi:hypothetical protein